MYRQNRAHLQGLEKQKTELEAAIPSLESELARAGNTLRDQLSRVESQLEASARAGDELREARRQQGDLDAMLESESFASDTRLELDDVKEELRALSYDEGTYRQTYQSISELEPYAQLKVRLDQALAQLPEDEAALNQGKEFLAGRAAELENLEGQAGAMEAAITELPPAGDGPATGGYGSGRAGRSTPGRTGPPGTAGRGGPAASGPAGQA